MKRSDLKVGEIYAIGATKDRASEQYMDLIPAELLSIDHVPGAHAHLPGVTALQFRLVKPELATENRTGSWGYSKPKPEAEWKRERVVESGRYVFRTWADQEASLARRAANNEARRLRNVAGFERIHALAERLERIGFATSTGINADIGRIELRVDGDGRPEVHRFPIGLLERLVQMVEEGAAAVDDLAEPVDAPDPNDANSWTHTGDVWVHTGEPSP